MSQRFFDRSVLASRKFSFLDSMSDPSVVGDLNFNGNQVELMPNNRKYLVDMRMLEEERNSAWKSLLEMCNKSYDMLKKEKCIPYDFFPLGAC